MNFRLLYELYVYHVHEALTLLEVRVEVHKWMKVCTGS
jgi:hypothetical protein